MNIEKLKDTIQDCNINFLLGSGLSCPFLSALGNMETLLTELDSAAMDAKSKKIIRASLYKRYFDSVINKNLAILNADPATVAVLDQYKAFLHCLNSVLVKRKVTILSKEINLFTTNIDIFLDKALEDLNLEYNDGFNGRFKPTFNLNNFKIARSKKSLFYDKTAELPVFNLVKLHGSLSWEMDSTETSSSPASPTLLLTRSRIRSDSLRGWFRLPCPTNIEPAWPIPDSDLTRTFFPVFLPSTFPLSGRKSKPVAAASMGTTAPSGISRESN